MKKLKFWSGKKKKVKRFNVDIDHYLLPPPPPPLTPSTYHCCNCHHRCHYHNGSGNDLIQPSAPPLPHWLDFEQTQDTFLIREASSISFSTTPDSVQSQSQNEIAASLPASVSTNCSYQQYMVENPVLEVPAVLPLPRRSEIHNGIFDYGVNFGVHLVRCFCPCFHIHQIY